MITIQEKINNEIDGFVGLLKDFCKFTFEKDGHVNHVAFMLCPKDKNAEEFDVFSIIGLEKSFLEGKDREIVAKNLRKITEDVKPIAVAFVSEAWYVCKQKDEIENYLDKDGSYKDDSVPPSLASDKKEALMISVETYDKSKTVIWDIVREENKNPTLVKKADPDWMSKSGDYATKGVLSNLLMENYDSLAQELKVELEKNKN